MDTRTYAPEPARWQRALDGDRDAFEEAVAPLQDDLLAAARRQVEVERRAGRLREDALNAEELVGETLVRAYEHRSSFHAKRMRFRAWLIGIQHRALARLAADEARYDDHKAISINEEVSPNARYDAVEEQMYEFRDPFDVTTYDELIAGSAPDDVEIDLTDRTAALTDEERDLLDTADISPTARRIALFHDEFQLSLAEVAQILGQSLNETAEEFNLARTTLRERIGSSEEPDDPAVDSYTGDPI